MNWASSSDESSVASAEDEALAKEDRSLTASIEDDPIFYEQTITSAWISPTSSYIYVHPADTPEVEEEYYDPSITDVRKEPDLSYTDDDYAKLEQEEKNKRLGGLALLLTIAGVGVCLFALSNLVGTKLLVIMVIWGLAMWALGLIIATYSMFNGVNGMAIGSLIVGALPIFAAFRLLQGQ